MLGQGQNALAGLDAVQAGHLPVDEGDLVTPAGLRGLTDHVDRLLARCRLVGHQGHVGQHARQHGARVRIVVDDQHAPAAQVGLKQARARRGGPFAEACGKPEGASLAGLALDRDLAPHQLGQLLGDRQAKPGAAIFSGGGGVGLLEGLKQPLDLRLGHADAGVAHGKLDELAVGACPPAREPGRRPRPSR